MTPPTRRDTAEEARTRILSAAADCLVRDGLAKVRMAGIAEVAGVSSGLLHYHFDTKEQLFAAVLRYSSEQSNELTADCLERAGTDPAGRLATFLDRCLPSDERLTRDWLLWQELDLLCMRQPELAEVGAQVYDALYDAVADLIAAGVGAGVFALPPEEIRVVAESAVALCDGLGARVLAPEDLTLECARERVALAVGRLVGHRGPLPRPDRARRGTGA
ncbi:putative Transcriptional regulator, TetR family [Nostocoides japonicum T1-X7]|uniref:Putative Transcriptional regulator, TetR family n=1 Tax=Nostocoides japonicum T1-X7 TaxID=1194083 RepID=A0A077M167_9MICO|nr:TetR/AcrR family transcriptional regulator [Tetrasphaera japonica]CCH77945.1 putative Transcriptional regulator, TetR family [Tetrasphaera japonica T1-X7]